MNSDPIDIQAIAHLARVELTPEEARTLGGQLTRLLDYVAKLETLDLTAVEPTVQVFPRANVTRPDVVEPSLSPAEALRNAPAAAGGLFVVPKIVE